MNVSTIILILICFLVNNNNTMYKIQWTTLGKYKFFVLVSA